MRRVTIKEVAKLAGVSIATVDRVLNGREGVRPNTGAKVEAAIRQLSYAPSSVDSHIRYRANLKFTFVLPTGSSLLIHQLKNEIEYLAEHFSDTGITVTITEVDVFDPVILSETLRKVRPNAHGVAVVALDDRLVSDAINALIDCGVNVVTLVSDAPTSKRSHYIGIENAGAGRTASSLMGRFLSGRKGKIALLAGAIALRNHAERQYGFLQVMQRSHPQLQVLPVREMRDDPTFAEQVTAELLKKHPDLVGLYNVGAGNRGVIKALEQSGRADEVVYIAHDRNIYTQAALLRGTIDAILHQDTRQEIRKAAQVLLKACGERPVIPEPEQIRIEIYLKENLP